MFGSWMLYVVFVVAVGMLLIAICWTKKGQGKHGVKGARAVKQVDVVTDVPETVLAVEEVPATPRKRVKWMGVLTIDTATFQICGGCTSAWLGEYVHSERCPKCNGKLSKIVAEGAPLQYVVVPEERLTRLCAELWKREELSA